MVLDKCWRETRDGGKFLTISECSKECLLMAESICNMHWWM